MISVFLPFCRSFVISFVLSFFFMLCRSVFLKVVIYFFRYFVVSFFLSPFLSLLWLVVFFYLFKCHLFRSSFL